MGGRLTRGTARGFGEKPRFRSGKGFCWRSLLERAWSDMVKDEPLIALRSILLSGSFAFISVLVV
jgi:hypothetical protein